MDFIHCADLHLGSPFRNMTSNESANRRKGQFAVLDELISFAKNNGIKLVLIAGDVFDDKNVGSVITDRFFGALGSARDISFVIAPGNHDFYSVGGYYDSHLIPDNVHIFKNAELEYFDFDGVRVHGFAFTSQYMQSCVSLKPKLAEGKLNVLCCHGEWGVPVSSYCPINAADISGCGYDYVALGHIHDVKNVMVGKTTVAYSGCTEGRDFGECGRKGAFHVRFTPSEGGFTLEKEYPKLHVLSDRRYETVKVDVSGVSNDGECIEKITAVLEGIKGEKTSLAVRAVLEGMTGADYAVNADTVCRGFSAYGHFEIKDETMPCIDVKGLEDDKSIRGEFYRALKDKLESEDENERDTARAALKYGLIALEGRVSAK